MAIGQFIEKLIEKQGSRSNNAFARELGISPAAWSRIRRGVRPAGRQITAIALARWPELAYYLAEDAKAASKEVA